MISKKTLAKIVDEYAPIFVKELGLEKMPIKFIIVGNTYTISPTSKFNAKHDHANTIIRYKRKNPKDRKSRYIVKNIEVIISYKAPKTKTEAIGTLYHELLHCAVLPLKVGCKSHIEERLVALLEQAFLKRFVL